MDKKQKLAEARKALLAKRLKGTGKGSTLAAPKTEPIPRLAHSNPVPLSLAQQRFWFTHQLDRSQASHNMYDGWQVSGLFDYDALQWAFGRLVERQSVLRTQIKLVDGVPMQFRHPTAFFRFVLKVLHDPAEVEPFIQQEIGTPFDLLTEPLIRLHVIQLNAAQTEHILLLTIHHIISDEYSNALIWNELAAFYAEAMGETNALEALPIEYRDYSEWQASWLQKGTAKKQLGYWQKELEGHAPPLQLPQDHAQTGPPSGKGAILSRPLDPKLKQKLNTLAKKSGATPFMLWTAIFQLLLHRYTGEADIWLGTPIGNRQRPEIRKLVGLFLNTMIVRTQIDEKDTFNELLKKVQTAVLGAFGNQDVPFDQVVNAVQPNRNATSTPLFQTMLVYSPEPKPPQFTGLLFKKYQVKSQLSKLDLTLFVGDGNQPKLSIQYSTDLFSADTVKRMLGHLESLAHSIVQKPSSPVSKMPLLTDLEHQQILVDWHTPQSAPRADEKLLHSFILAHAKTKFNHPAVVCGSQTLTYRELDLRSGNLARYLQANGVNGNTNRFVGLMVDRRPEMLVGILAVLRAGGAYVPIDPQYPADRIEHILTDANLDIVLTAGDFELPSHIKKQPKLIDLTQALPAFDPTDATHIAQPTPDSLAYLIYTSGSTGKPKGVMVNHANIVHSTTARYSFYPHPAEKFLLLSSFAFDSSMVGIFWTLCQGGTLVLPENGQHQNISWLNRTIMAEQVTHLLALPSLYQILLDESQPEQLQSLNTVMVAGEACHAGLVEAHYQQVPGADLYNEYGPTEGTVWSHAYRFPKDFSGPTVPIGTAIPNVTQFILDAYDQPVPVGVPGELVIGGAGITLGYLNRPQLTAERFVTLPHLTSDPAARYYRTGDLVKWRADGQVIFLGRVDHQVKIRGYRVELGEIEATLLNHPRIQTAAVDLFRPPAGNDRAPDAKLVAWFTAEAELDTNTLSIWMAAQLPGYMVPAIFTQLEQLPLTPNGKVNRKALPQPHIELGANTGRGFEPPNSQTEETLVAIWQNALGVEQISTADNFFELGGHSLMAIKIFAQIEKRLGANLPLATIFQYPTVRELAQMLQKQQDERSLVEKLVVPIQPNGSKPPFFFLHDGAGYIYQYEPIAAKISKDRPVYGIIPEDWNGEKREPKPLQDLVDQYVQVIQVVQPTGPYHLGGFSLGGLLAFEIAAKLQAAGFEVGTLTMIEPTPWNTTYLVKGDRNLHGIERHLDNLKRLKQETPGRIPYYFGASIYGRWYKVVESIQNPIRQARIDRSGAFVPRTLRDHYYLGYYSGKLLTNYTPAKFSGKMIYFMSNRGPLIDPVLGWDTLNNGDNIIHMMRTNDHSRMIEAPHIHEIGTLLAQELEQELE